MGLGHPPPLPWKNPKIIPTSNHFFLSKASLKNEHFDFDLCTRGIVFGRGGDFRGLDDESMAMVKLVDFYPQCIHCHIGWSENMKHFGYPEMAWMVLF